MELLAELKGQNGALLVYNDRIEISRKTIGGFVAQGAKGNRRFYYSSINSIEYKTPTIWSNGYLKVISSGTKDIDASVGLLSSSMESFKDPNTLILRAFTKDSSKKCDQAYELVIKQIETVKSESGKKNNSISNLDEIKKLGELFKEGIITKDEFEQQKKKLLQ